MVDTTVGGVWLSRPAGLELERPKRSASVVDEGCLGTMSLRRAENRLATHGERERSCYIVRCNTKSCGGHGTYRLTVVTRQRELVDILSVMMLWFVLELPIPCTTSATSKAPSLGRGNADKWGFEVPLSQMVPRLLQKREGRFLPQVSTFHSAFEPHRNSHASACMPWATAALWSCPATPNSCPSNASINTNTET